MNSKIVVVLSILLVLFSLALLFIYFFSKNRATIENNFLSNQEQPQENVEKLAGEIVLYGVPIKYSIVDTPLFDDKEIDVPIFPYWNGDFCLIQVKKDIMQEPEGIKKENVGTLASSVGYCLSEGALKGRYNNTVEHSWAYNDAYKDAYITKCGYRLEPLGWAGSTDGQCEVPSPTEVAEKMGI